MNRYVLLLMLAALTAPAAGGAIPLDQVASIPFVDLVLSYVPHGPIDIDGNADICGDVLSSGVRNCETADGTSANPYVISGWSVEASPDQGIPAVRIRNTTLHLVVTDNELMTPRAGGVQTIVLDNVANLVLDENFVYSGPSPAIEATLVRGGGRAFLSNNTFVAGESMGTSSTLVRLVDVRDAAIEGNSFVGPGQSRGAMASLLEVRDGDNVRLRGNAYQSSDGVALVLTNLSALRLIGEVVGQVRDGIRIAASPNATLANLVLSNVLNGVRLEDSGTVTMSASSISDYYPCHPSCLPRIGLEVVRSSLVLNATRISGFDQGITMQSTAQYSLLAECVTVEGNDGVGLLIDELGNSSLKFSNIDGNGVGVRNTNVSVFKAEHNWWGSATGPTHGQNPAGSGDSVIGKVDYSPFLDAPSPCAPA